MGIIRILMVTALLLAFACSSPPPAPPPPAPPATVVVPPPPPPPPDPTALHATVPFTAGSANLDDAGIRTLDAFAKKLGSSPDRRVHVVGYSEPSAADGADEWMSERRAKRVAAYLHALGIPADKITLEGRGSSEPKGATGAAGNRIVEVSVR